MTLATPIIHCVADAEPPEFYDGQDFMFAVNLGFEAPSTDTDKIAQDELHAPAYYSDFLDAIPAVHFRLFSIKGDEASGWTADYVAKLDPLPTPQPVAPPKDMLNWLESEGKKLTAKYKDLRYWSTAPAAEGGKADAEFAGAGPRLRSVQAWNAPIGHKFSLTHVVTVPLNSGAAENQVILPYFGDPGDPVPPPSVKRLPPDPDNQGLDVFDCEYDPKSSSSHLETVICRTNPIDCVFDLDKLGITPEGYVVVDTQADDVRRVLAWFEDRASSVMAIHNALTPSTGAENDKKDFEKLFGIVQPDPEIDKDTYHWGALPWFVAARLISAVDGVIIALIKPEQSDTDFESEGELLAPFVSALLTQLRLVADTFQLPSLAQNPRLLAQTIRGVFKSHCPLSKGKATSRAEVVRALCALYGLPELPPKDNKASAISDPRKAPQTVEEFVSASLRTYSGYDAGGIPDHYNTYVKALGAFSATLVSQALLNLEQTLLDEAGAEAATVKLFEMMASDGKFQPLIADAWVAKLGLGATPPNGNQTLSDAVTDAVRLAWSTYRQLLDGDFNGAQAVRQSVGSSFTHALIKHAWPLPGDRLAALRDAVKLAPFYTRRLFDKGTGQAFDDVALCLIRPEALSPAVPDQPEVEKYLNKIYDVALLKMTEIMNSEKRFIPDAMPQPLAVQIAAGIDGAHAADFERRFNGLALAIQRIDVNKDTDPWAHAHLADLSWPNDPSVTPRQQVAGALHPMLPAITDGRGPMYIEYHGFPFAEEALEAGMPGLSEEALDARQPFYRVQPYMPNGHEPVPALAYGRQYRTFSFATSNAGALPLALQRSADEPWMPKAKVEPPVTPPPAEPAPVPPPPPPPPILIGEFDCQRRTAIAQTELAEKGVVRHIGAPIDSVLPLSTDYPRVALSATKDEPGVCDLFRDADGRGTMIAKSMTKSDWGFNDILILGKPKTLRLRFFENVADDPDQPGYELPLDLTKVDLGKEPGVVLKIDSSKDPEGECTLTLTCGESEIDKVTIPANPHPDSPRTPFGWLRLVLESDTASVLSFAQPGAKKQNNMDAPLLLLAPENPEWRREIPTRTEIKVVTPRVTYRDFERWFANPDLLATLGAGGKDFMSTLLSVYMLRTIYTDLPELARLIDRLPDPAMSSMRLGLAATDSLGGPLPQQGVQPQYRGLDLVKGIKAFKDALDAAIKTAVVYKELDDEKAWGPKQALAALKALDEYFCFTVSLAADKTLGLTPVAPDPADVLANEDVLHFTATVPPGVCARFYVETLVAKSHFEAPAAPPDCPAVLHAGLKQYATHTVHGTHLAFPAAAINIEVMYDQTDLFVEIPDLPALHQDKAILAAYEDYNKKAIALADKMIGYETVDRQRRFRLTSQLPPTKAKPDVAVDASEKQLWRTVGEVDVTTQRWRPSGRPLYNFIEPREIGTWVDSSPLCELKIKGNDERVPSFEREVFFDRPDIDAQTITQRLEPISAATRLQEFDWAAPSATYFRHRFTLRSRYAGALTRHREVAAWPVNGDASKTTEKLPYGWTRRAVMLADLPNLQLTRPQLRALVPLTSTPGGDDARVTPPVAAMLQEPPFAGAGLADRIACEIVTGLGYGFRAPTNEGETKDPSLVPVEIRDTRKEAGPPPYLDYQPLKDDVAKSLVLRGEGPVGLTFDPSNISAPAFANAMMVLTPDLLSPSEETLPEELMAGIALRRYLDPAWTTAPVQRPPAQMAPVEEAPAELAQLPGETCWWITLKSGSLNGDVLFYTPEGSDKPLPLLHLEGCTKILKIQTSKKTLDGFGAAPGGKDAVDLARIGLGKSGLAVLHQVIAPGRYATSVFLTGQPADITRGQSGAPQLVTGFEWSPPSAKRDDGEDDRPPAVTLTGQIHEAWETRASPATRREWVKTSRDFDTLYIPDAGKWQLQPNNAGKVSAALDTNHHFLNFAYYGIDGSIVVPCASTFYKPYPLHVQRHVAVVASYFLSELGRPMEVFGRTAAWLTQASRLVGLDGKMTTQKPYQPRETVVRVVEFETPAQILCDSATAIEKYKTTYFDLVSTGFVAPAENIVGHSLHAYLRICGPQASVAKFMNLTLNFTLNPAKLESKTPDLTVTVDLTKVIEFTAVIDLTELPDTAAKPVITAVRLIMRPKVKDMVVERYEVWLVAADGRHFKAVKPTLAGDLNFVDEEGNGTWPGLFVNLSKEGEGEMWTDMSLLHSAQTGDAPAFDFDWLFTPAADADPITSVSAAGLNQMVEAQARIICVSSPIPISKH